MQQRFIINSFLYNPGINTHITNTINHHCTKSDSVQFTLCWHNPFSCDPNRSYFFPQHLRLILFGLTIQEHIKTTHECSAVISLTYPGPHVHIMFLVLILYSIRFVRNIFLQSTRLKMKVSIEFGPLEQDYPKRHKLTGSG